MVEFIWGMNAGILLALIIFWIPDRLIERSRKIKNDIETVKQDIKTLKNALEKK